jgi:hypothetical protein
MEDIKIEESWNRDDRYVCPICGKDYTKMGISTHIWRSHGEGKKHNPNKGYDSGQIIWNKGLNKENNNSVRKISETYKQRVRDGAIIPSFTGKKHTKETKRKIGTKLSKNNHGGRCKWYTVKNSKGESVRVQGTWEVRFVDVLNIIDEDWIKPTMYHKEHSFEWTDDLGEIHIYTPDFWSPKFQKYFEVKGYWWGEDKRKMELVVEQNPSICFEVVQKKELESYEKLVKNTPKYKGSKAGL